MPQQHLLFSPACDDVIMCFFTLIVTSDRDAASMIRVFAKCIINSKNCNGTVKRYLFTNKAEWWHIYLTVISFGKKYITIFVQ